MTKSIEDRVKHLEEYCEYLQSQHMAWQNLFIAALTTINRDQTTRDQFAEDLRLTAEGSFDHALSTRLSDRAIHESRQTMAAVVGPHIAKYCNLP
jgi:hypothetical protein